MTHPATFYARMQAIQSESQAHTAEQIYQHLLTASRARILDLIAQLAIASCSQEASLLAYRASNPSLPDLAFIGADPLGLRKFICVPASPAELTPRLAAAINEEIAKYRPVSSVFYFLTNQSHPDYEPIHQQAASLHTVPASIIQISELVNAMIKHGIACVTQVHHTYSPRLDGPSHLGTLIPQST